MPKPNKQIIIDAIVSEIEKGTDRGKVIAKYCKKFQKSPRTVDTYWKIANEQHRVLQDKAKRAADASYIKASEEAAKKAVMSKAERLEVLSNIARGEVTMKVLDRKKNIIEVPVSVETLEKIKAIAELNKMEGDYAETSIKLKGDKENPLFDLANATVIFK